MHRVTDRSYQCAAIRTKLYPPESGCYRNGSVPDEKIILPEIYDSNFSISTMSPGDFVRAYEFLCNGTTYYLESYSPKNDLFHLMENGAIYVKKSIDGGADFWLAAEDYCLASRPTENGTRIAVSVCKPLLVPATTPFTVMPEIMVYPITMSLSLPFLVATFLIYTILPELKNVHGLILRIYVACLFVLYTLFLILAVHPEFLCTYYIGVVLHFLVMAIFFWLNVMSFDIWWTFRRFRSVQGNSAKGNRKKIVMYSLYAWGLSALIAGAGWIVDTVPTVPAGVIRPGLRTGYCWFNGRKRTRMLIPVILQFPVLAVILAVFKRNLRSSRLMSYNSEENLDSDSAWLYGPMAVTLTFNTCFFVLTAATINRHEKDTALRLKGCDYRRHNDEKQRFHLYLKLFIVMGITWSAEFVFWKFGKLSAYISFILDLPNLLQGVTIFMIFVWKGKIKRLLRKRLESKDRNPRSHYSMDRTYRQTSLDSCTTSTSVKTKLEEYSEISSQKSKHITDESCYL